MNVYLDNCILVDIENNAIKLSDLKLSSIDLQLVYSIAHLFEAKQKSNITDDFIIERCGLLHRLTNSSYVNYNHFKKHLEIISRSPLMQCDEIRPHHIYDIEGSINKIKEISGTIRAIADFPLKAVYNNNLSSEEFLKSVNTLFLAALGKSLKEFVMEQASNIQGTLPFDVVEVIEGVILFHLIDELGYYQDSKGKAKSRLWDSLHVYFACASSLFITSDRNTYRKAQVIFDYFKSTTKAIYHIKT